MTTFTATKHLNLIHVISSCPICSGIKKQKHIWAPGNKHELSYSIWQAYVSLWEGNESVRSSVHAKLCNYRHNENNEPVRFVRTGKYFQAFETSVSPKAVIRRTSLWRLVTCRSSKLWLPRWPNWFITRSNVNQHIHLFVAASVARMEVEKCLAWIPLGSPSSLFHSRG